MATDIQLASNTQCARQLFRFLISKRFQSANVDGLVSDSSRNLVPKNHIYRRNGVQINILWREKTASVPTTYTGRQPLCVLFPRRDLRWGSKFAPLVWMPRQSLLECPHCNVTHGTGKKVRIGGSETADAEGWGFPALTLYLP